MCFYQLMSFSHLLCLTRAAVKLCENFSETRVWVERCQRFKHLKLMPMFQVLICVRWTSQQTQQENKVKKSVAFHRRKYYTGLYIQWQTLEVQTCVTEYQLSHAWSMVLTCCGGGVVNRHPPRGQHSEIVSIPIMDSQSDSNKVPLTTNLDCVWLLFSVKLSYYTQVK